MPRSSPSPRLWLPVVHGMRGKEFVESDNLFDVGDRAPGIRVRVPGDEGM